jgi:hypothetical protein
LDRHLQARELPGSRGDPLNTIATFAIGRSTDGERMAVSSCRVGTDAVGRRSGRLCAADYHGRCTCSGPSMIVSHRHRFVFAAIPKTGTHSVREALREQLGPDDIEQVGLFTDRRFPFPELAKIRHGHLGLAQVRPFLGDEAFDAYLKFCFVRNPFDRFVSYCAFMTRQRPGLFEHDPRGVMRHILHEVRPVGHILFQPQSSLVTDADGLLLADMVGRVEQMQASYDAICERIGIPSRTLDRVNASSRGDYRPYYDQALVDEVGALYRRDLELFGYEF